MNQADGDAEDRLAQRFAEFVAMLQQGIAIDFEQFSKDEPELRAQLHEALQLARDIANPLARRTPEIPGFQLLRPLGQGSSSTVWLARQQNLAREVALKVVHLDTLPTQSARDRCLREARTLARIHDPRVVAVHDVVEHGRWLAISMDHVDGPNLRAVLREIQSHREQAPTATLAALLGRDKKHLDATWSGWVVRQGIRLARALAGLHAHGLVHRDVKPENVLLTHEGDTVLADLGLARAASELAAVGFSGTPFYAAPEQWRSDAQLDGRTDVYSLGVLLYELLSLALPVDRGQRPTSKPQPLPLLRSRARHVSRDLATVVQKAVELDPERRYLDANAFADDLERVCGLLPILASPPSLPWRVFRFAQRHRRSVAAACLGVAIAVAAFVPLVDALRQEVRAPTLAAAATAEARGLVFDVIASRGEPRDDNDTALDRDAAATLRSAVGHYDTSLAHRDDQALRLERDIAQLAASALEARRSDFPAQLTADFGGERNTSNDARRHMRTVASRWLSGLSTATGIPRTDLGPADLTALGLLACLLGDLGGCEQYWNQLDPLAPTTPLVDIGRGILFAADERHELALPCLLRAANEFPQDTEVALRLADAAVRGGNIGLANSALDKVAPQTRSSSARARRIEADIARLQGDLATARRTYASLVEEDADGWLPGARLAAIDFESGRQGEAIACLRQLVRTHPEVAWLRLELARAAISAKRFDIYVEQARFAASLAASRKRISRGTKLSLAAILDLGGAFDAIAPEALRTEPRATLDVKTPSVASAVAEQRTRAQLEAILVRFVSFDRSIWPECSGREGECLRGISQAVSATLAIRDLLIHASPCSGTMLLVAASAVRAVGPSAVRDAVARAWLTTARVFDRRRHRIASNASPRPQGRASGVATLRSDEGTRVAVLTRVDEQPKGTSYLRAVTPFGVAASASLRLSITGLDGNEICPPRVVMPAVSTLSAHCASPGDLDGDGCDDIVAVRATLGQSPGTCAAFSGRDGASLWSRSVGRTSLTVPWSIAFVSDLNNDGVRDIAVGLPNLSHPLSPNTNLELLSGRDGGTIAARSGAASTNFGIALAHADNWLAIGCPHRHAEPGSVEILDLSGNASTGTTTTLRVPQATAGFGRCLAALPDLDGDGYADLAVSDASPAPTATERSTVWIMSPATGRTLWTASSAHAADGFGSSICATRDHDGDDVDDVWIAAPAGDVGACGEITLHSGRNGDVLHRVGGDQPETEIGSRVFATRAADVPPIALGNSSAGHTRIFFLPERRDLAPHSASGEATDRAK